MNRLEAIIEKEKEVSYSQEDKDIFGSHILILVHQEQEFKKFKRKLCLGLFLGMGIMGFLIPHLDRIVNELTSGLSDAIPDGVFPVIALSYGLSFALLILLNKTEVIFD